MDNIESIEDAVLSPEGLACRQAIRIYLTRICEERDEERMREALSLAGEFTTQTLVGVVISHEDDHDTRLLDAHQLGRAVANEIIASAQAALERWHNARLED